MKKWLRRGALAKALGTTSPTVKYYTALGIFPVQRRTDHGQNLYDFDSVKEKYARVRELKEKRLTIQEIRDRLKIEVLIQD